MKFALALAALTFARAEDAVEDENADDAAEECDEESEAFLEAVEAAAAEVDDECEGDDCPTGEEEAGSAALPIILVLAAIGGLAGAFYCHKNNKACFAKKDAAPEGGFKESLI